jgi:hypothetical protein
MSKNGSSVGGSSGAGRSKSRKTRATDGGRGDKQFKSPSEHKRLRDAGKTPNLPKQEAPKPSSREARAARISKNLAARREVNGRKQERAKASAAKKSAKAKASKQKARSKAQKAARRIKRNG